MSAKLLGVAAVMLLGACYAPSYENGKLPCSAKGECPDGLFCAADQRCWKVGSGPLVDGGPDATAPTDGGAVDAATEDAPNDAAPLDAPPIDAPLPDGAPPIVYPPAAVWMSSGGGSSMAQSGRQLSVSFGGTVVVGASAAGSGDQITFGYLSNVTY